MKRGIGTTEIERGNRGNIVSKNRRRSEARRLHRKTDARGPRDIEANAADRAPASANGVQANSASSYVRADVERASVSELHEKFKTRKPAPRFKVDQKAPMQVVATSDFPDKPAGEAAYLNAFGTCELTFANWLFGHLMNAGSPANASVPMDEKDLNGALAAMSGIGPQNETEAMLAAQMVAVHFAAMNALRRLKNTETIQQQDSNGNLATKLLRTFTAQVEALQRLRGKGQQTVRVEHVTVNAGGQAIVGNVTGGGGVKANSKDQPDAKQITHAPGEALPSDIEAHSETVPVTSG